IGHWKEQEFACWYAASTIGGRVRLGEGEGERAGEEPDVARLTQRAVNGLRIARGARIRIDNRTVRVVRLLDFPPPLRRRPLRVGRILHRRPRRYPPGRGRWRLGKRRVSAQRQRRRQSSRQQQRGYTTLTNPPEPRASGSWSKATRRRDHLPCFPFGWRPAEHGRGRVYAAARCKPFQ